MKRMLCAAAAAIACAASMGAVNIKVEHTPRGQVSADTPFTVVPPPSADDAATDAVFSVIDGVPSKLANAGKLDKLHDGKMPPTEDAPAQNFFFEFATIEGRVRIDLGKVIPVAQINSYSWHKSDRAPQVYKVYGSDGLSAGFNPEPKIGTGPAKCGWTMIALVDTRPQHNGHFGGRDGVSITDSSGSLGNYRYLLFEMFVTESKDTYGHTFYSEIDVVQRK
jgi:hypothetical protein